MEQIFYPDVHTGWLKRQICSVSNKMKLLSKKFATKFLIVKTVGEKAVLNSLVFGLMRTKGLCHLWKTSPTT